MIKQGEVAFVKISGEPVFARRTGLTSGSVANYKHLGDLVEVTRTLQGRDGLTYTTDTFFEAELESLDEQRERFVAEQQKAMAKFGPKIDTPSSQDDGLPFN